MRATPAGSERPCANAAVLYVGEVMHARLKPMGHRFSYRVMSLLIDLDRLADADRQSPVFGIGKNRFGEEAGQVAHNSFVHAFTELGPLGGMVFLGAFYLAMRALWTEEEAARWWQAHLPQHNRSAVDGAIEPVPATWPS